MVTKMLATSQPIGSRHPPGIRMAIRSFAIFAAERGQIIGSRAARGHVVDDRLRLQTPATAKAAEQPLEEECEEIHSRACHSGEKSCVELTVTNVTVTRRRRSSQGKSPSSLIVL
jgi:hypothetical protein